MAKMVEITCKCGCGRKKMVREADRNRGWGLFFSKSCKAKFQERNTGQYKAHLNGHGVSHAAKRRGEDPEKAVLDYAQKHRIETVDGIEVDSDYIGITDREWDEIQSSAEMGWDAHKDCY